MLLPTTCASMRVHSTSWKNATAPASNINGSTQAGPGNRLNVVSRERAAERGSVGRSSE